MFKGLSSYPVFLITLFSLVTISYLASLMLSNVTNRYVDNTVSSYAQASLRYISLNGAVYLEVVGIDCLELYEVAILINGSRRTFKHVGSAGLFGPLAIPKESSEIVLLCRTGLGEPKVSILDILSSKRILNGVNFSINRANPPLLRILVNSTNPIERLSFIHGTRSFYALKPIALPKEFTLTRGYVYNITEYDLVVVDDNVNPVVVFNGTLSGNVDLDGRFRDLLGLYGEVEEYREYTLYNYLSGSYILNPILRIDRLYSISRFITYTVNLRLRDNLALDETIAEFGIEHSALISIVDIYGNDYLADVTINYRLMISDGSTVRTIDLGSVTGVNDREIVANLRGLTVLPRANYNLRLSITFNIYIWKPPIGPVYVSIKHQVSGGLSKNVFLRTYLFDKLVFNMDGVVRTYYPLTNGTKVNVIIRANLFNNVLNVTLNGQGFLVVNFSSEFRGRSVFVVNTIHPSAIVEAPPFVALNAMEANVRIYRLNVSDGSSVIYGLFFNGLGLSLRVIYRPVVLIDRWSYIIVESNVDYVYLLNTTSKLKLYIHGNGVYSYLEAPVSTRFLRFVIHDKLVYETPVFVVEDVPRGLALDIYVTYFDGSSRALRALTDAVFSLEEELVVSLNLKLYNPFVDNEVSIFVSWRTSRVVLLSLSSSIHLVNEVKLGALGSRKYAVFVLDNGSCIPTDTFGLPGSILG